MEINVPGLLRIKKDAMHKIGKYVKQCGYSRIALICGEGIRQMFNTVLEISFASSDVKVVFEFTASSNNLDDAFSCAKKIPKPVQAVVAIGGGKAIDFSKYVALINQLPVFSVPTCTPSSSARAATSGRRTRRATRSSTTPTCARTGTRTSPRATSSVSIPVCPCKYCASPLNP